jgi:thiamine pyrophosphate-dependent acetolactate synthase large subunit-like protein
MNRKETMLIVAKLRGDAALLVGPGVSGGLIFENGDSPASIYNMEMAYAVPMGLGIALGRPLRNVLVVEGEGSFFAGSTVLSTIWRMRPKNLTVLITDNGVWGTGDGKVPSATSFGTDLAALALANGWDKKQVHTCDQPEDLYTRLEQALEGGGPNFIVCKNDPAADEYMQSSLNRPRASRHQLDCAVLMRRNLNGDW